MRRLLFSYQKIAKSLLMSEALEKMVDEVCETLECDRASVFMLDELNAELWTKVGSGSENTTRIPLDSGIEGAVVRNDSAENIEDVYRDARFERATDKRTGYRTKSMLCVPIKDQHDQIIGVTEAINKLGGDRFARDDLCLLEWFSANAGIILRNSIRFDESILHLHRLRQMMIGAGRLSE